MIRVDSSSDKEDNNAGLMRRLNLVLNQYREPRVAVERAIMSEDPQLSTSGNVGQPRARCFIIFIQLEHHRRSGAFIISRMAIVLFGTVSTKLVL